jgi:hypothetical protein
MGRLVAAGGILIEGKAVKNLEAKIGDCCKVAGFPANAEFKWSPGRELWMRTNLVDAARSQFFLDVLAAAQDHDATALVVIEDGQYKTATGVKTPEDDVTRLLLERIHNCTPDSSDGCIVIVDRPSGGRADEDRFLSRCLESLQSGTDYVKHDKIALNVLSTPSKLVRLLQLADLVTSCTTALVSGESMYAPAVFEKIKPLLDGFLDRIGGFGVKIHPDHKYVNLYHWLLGDTVLWRGNCGHPLPISGRPYKKGPDSY